MTKGFSLGLAPSISVDAFDATVEQLGVLDDRFMTLLLHTDILVARGFEMTTETKNTLLHIVRLLRAVRHDLLSIRSSYRVLREGPLTKLPS